MMQNSITDGDRNDLMFKEQKHVVIDKDTEFLERQYKDRM